MKKAVYSVELLAEEKYKQLLASSELRRLNTVEFRQFLLAMTHIIDIQLQALEDKA